LLPGLVEADDTEHQHRGDKDNQAVRLDRDESVTKSEWQEAGRASGEQGKRRKDRTRGRKQQQEEGKARAKEGQTSKEAACQEAGRAKGGRR
jgi:hypothetical protein